MTPRRHDDLPSLADHLKGRDVRAILRGALDSRQWWVIFGPGDSGAWRVDSYARKGGTWTPTGDGLDGDADEWSGWDAYGALFVRAFTQP